MHASVTLYLMQLEMKLQSSLYVILWAGNESQCYQFKKKKEPNKRKCVRTVLYKVKVKCLFIIVSPLLKGPANFDTSLV